MGKQNSVNLLSTKHRKELLDVLQRRFENNMQRHKGISWHDIEIRLQDNDKLWSLSEMERTGGEPDVVVFGGGIEQSNNNVFYYIDCSKESPNERRSLCYDREALNARKEHKPQNSAVDLATTMGIELLTAEEYNWLQQIESFDTKTSSWVKTPQKIRALGGALFCDRRYDTVFVYHNGADSYYAARGFRGKLII